MSELSLLKEELFGDPHTAISDIKFDRGERSDCSIEDIAASIRAAIAAVRAGGGREIDLSF
jgi:hypothetical protein